MWNFYDRAQFRWSLIKNGSFVGKLKLADCCLIIRNIYMHLKLFKRETLEERIKKKNNKNAFHARKLSFAFYLELHWIPQSYHRTTQSENEKTWRNTRISWPCFTIESTPYHSISQLFPHALSFTLPSTSKFLGQELQAYKLICDLICC